MKSSARVLTGLVVAVLGSAACAGKAATPPAPATASAAELEALYRARTDSARSRYTEADVGFVTGMIGHHAQALVMAGFAPTHGAGAAIRVLSGRIINAQEAEIALMQSWLRDRGRPVPDAAGHGHHAHMPGMLTAEQMQELDAARGPAFDRLFLTFMIQHHQGAVTMVHALFGTDGAARGDAIFKLASDIQVDQITEIRRMELMLKALP